MGLLDVFARHLDPPRPALTQAAERKPRADLGIELGVSGLQQWGGFVREERLPELQGQRWTTTVLDMVTDPTVGAVLFAIEMLVRQVDWRVDPDGTDPADQEAADFVQDCLDHMQMTWEDTLAEILSMLPWGYCVMELVLGRRDDGTIGWAKWGIRAQETLQRWEFDDRGDATAMVQVAPPDFQTRTIPLEKALLFRTSARKNNPEGVSILRRAWRPWYFRRRIEQLEAIGIERDLAGLPVLYAPVETLAKGGNDVETLKKLVTNIRRDEQEGVLMPMAYDDKGHQLYELKLLASAGSRQLPIGETITRYTQQIAMSVLADVILLGHETVGSYALSSSKTELFSMAIGAWLDSIAATVNRFAIPRLLAVNGMQGVCHLAHGDIETANLAELGPFLKVLSDIGMPLFPDSTLESALREMAGLPEKSENSEAMPAPEPAPPAPAPTDQLPPVEDLPAEEG